MKACTSLGVLLAVFLLCIVAQLYYYNSDR